MVLLVRMASFGMEDFAKKFGELKPSQFVDVISLVGDKADNIPGNPLACNWSNFLLEVLFI